MMLMENLLLQLKCLATLDLSCNRAYFTHEYPCNKNLIYQHRPLSGSGLTFTVTVNEELVRFALKQYGLHLDDAEIHNFVSNFLAWTYDILTKADLSRHKHSILGAVISTVLGTIIGGVVGFLVGGPYGTGAEAVHGAAIGMNLGSKIPSRNVTHLDGVAYQFAQGNSDAMRSYIDFSPASGPYNVNSNSGRRDIQKLTSFTPIIPTSPGSQKFRMWLPSNNVYQLRTQNLHAAICYREGPD